MMAMIVIMMVVVHDGNWSGLWFIITIVLQLFMIVMVRRQVVVHDEGDVVAVVHDDHGPEVGGAVVVHDERP